MFSPKCNSCFHGKIGRRLWEFGHFQSFELGHGLPSLLQLAHPCPCEDPRCEDVRDLGIFGESIWFVLSCDQTWPENVENHPLYYNILYTFRWCSMIFPLQAACLRNFQLPRVITGGYLYLVNAACLLLSFHYLFFGVPHSLFYSYPDHPCMVYLPTFTP